MDKNVDQYDSILLTLKELGTTCFNNIEQIELVKKEYPGIRLYFDIDRLTVIIKLHNIRYITTNVDSDFVKEILSFATNTPVEYKCPCFFKTNFANYDNWPEDECIAIMYVDDNNNYDVYASGTKAELMGLMRRLQNE